MSNSKLVNCVAVFVTLDIQKTVRYYQKVLGFRAVEHYDKAESFAALYRDAVEIVVVQSKHGQVLSNRERYGAGYDVYLDPENIEDVDTLCAEFKAKGAKIASPPGLTAYGSYEFVLEDIDGRLIGIGRIKDEKAFFRDRSF